MIRSTPASSTAIAAKLHEAVALHNQGQLLRAQLIYEEILRVEPRHFDALHLSGVIAAASGAPSRAVELIGRAIDLDPGSSIAHNNRGAAQLELRLWKEALASFDRAIALKQEYAEAHYNRGNALKELERWEQALGSYERALSLKPAYPQAHSNRGVVLAALGRFEASIASFDAAIALAPDVAQAHYNRANALCGRRDWQAALAGFDRALELAPHYAQAHANRGFVLHELRRIDESLASCERALALNPDCVQGHCNRGSVLLAQRRVTEALLSYDRALAIDPDHAPGRVNRALALLLAGEYERGWADYEWRWRDRSSWVIGEKRNFRQPQWLGEVSPSGKTILLQSEQGYGDSIQFCRYAARVASLGARVILEVPRALAPLLRSLQVQVVVQGDPLPAFDMFCPLLSLPYAFRTALSSIPTEVPYLRASEERRRVWRDRLGARRRPRIGLVWSGGFRPARPELWSVNERRNIALAKFAALGSIEADFYSLQKGEAAETELAELESGGWEGPRIENLISEVRDFDDSAALIEQLDLVISVDTAIAHLAGALAKPVWILNRFDACWRWLLDRDDSPWYPTARLYRQERPGDWDPVMRNVARDLAGWLSGSSRHPGS
jgi:tetratricopeptide (TPR) repeat protein